MSLAVLASHEFLKARLKPGGCALDATAGRGRDTEFLAIQLGAGGRVHACDIQPEALEATKRRWEALPDPKATLQVHLCGHEVIGARLAQAGGPPLNAVIFNLGYLPGGDHSLVTQPETTVAALDQILPQLAPAAVIAIVVYPRHPGGREETDRVLAWAGALPPREYDSQRVQPLNLGPDRPELITVERHPLP